MRKRANTAMQPKAYKRDISGWKVFYRLGLLDAPSDESWERKQKEIIEKRPLSHRAGDRLNRRLKHPGSDLPAAR